MLAPRKIDGVTVASALYNLGDKSKTELLLANNSNNAKAKHMYAPYVS